MQAIYKPKGRAGEYCSYALNIYTGCNHGCDYCFANMMATRWGRDFTDVREREGIIDAVQKQLSTGVLRDELIHLCFSCDPYPATPVDTAATRHIIQALKDSGNHVQILTKGAKRAYRDFDLLDSDDWFGVTISGFDDSSCRREPGADTPSQRLVALADAHALGINTWVSCEPVIDPEVVYQLIEHCGEIIDLYKIGKMNYKPSANINWAEFGKKCERLCIKHGRTYYIKDDLRKEMEGGGQA